MSFAKDVIKRQTLTLHKMGVKISWIGSPNKLWKSLINVIEKGQELTKKNKVIKVNFCINYSGRDEIIYALNKSIKKGKTRITKKSFEKELMIPTPIDLLIRSSGEKRISNFLLWQIAYAEIIWVDKFWPDFDRETFDFCIDEFNKRNRRFGKV
jgi:undecaprenyl diphosphate synthase